MHNVYLIGMMGAGKTSVGEALAKELGCAFLDLDGAIEKTSQMTVNEIFEARGEPYFRRLEKAALKGFAAAPSQVVATGGGIVLDPENVNLMRSTGIVVYLKVPFEDLWSRIQHKTDRPLLKVPHPRALFEKLFQERRPLYEAALHCSVMTADKDVCAIVQDIVSLLRSGEHARS
jgi:shikimate kinase